MTTVNVKVHPVVLFNIMDAYERRNRDQERIIGTLLGSQDKSGAVEISNSFVVQHREANGEVAIDIEVAKDLLELYRKVNANENIVGWFSTGNVDVNEYSVLIHDYYSRETPNPIHLTISSTPTGISCKAYVSTPFGVATKGTMFSPVQCLVKTSGYETEMVGLQSCMAAVGITGGNRAQEKSFESELDMILHMTSKCVDSISVLQKFIDENILSSSGSSSLKSSQLSLVASNEIGRNLMSMVESLAPFGSDDNEELNTNLKDLLMVIYLANLSKTQLVLHEKLSLL